MAEGQATVAAFGIDAQTKNPVLLACVPEADLPPNIPLFAFVRGTVSSSQENARFHSFALTLSDGSHLHGHCCTHYHRITDTSFQASCLVLLVQLENHHTMRTLVRSVYATLDGLDEGFQRTHAEKMHTALDSLLTKKTVTVNDQTLKLVAARGLTVTSFRLDEEAADESWGQELPPRDINWEALFMTLSPEVIIHLFTALLCEQQILLLSSDVGKLAEVAEGLLALLYPFKWCHTYIPLLPRAVLDVVQAPFPFMLGAHKETTTNLPMIRDAAGNTVPFIPPGVWQVDLDNGTVFGPGDNSSGQVHMVQPAGGSAEPMQPFEPLPQRLHVRLIRRLGQAVKECRAGVARKARTQAMALAEVEEENENEDEDEDEEEEDDEEEGEDEANDGDDEGGGDDDEGEGAEGDGQTPADQQGDFVAPDNDDSPGGDWASVNSSTTSTTSLQSSRSSTSTNGKANKKPGRRARGRSRVAKEKREQRNSAQRLQRLQQQQQRQISAPVNEPRLPSAVGEDDRLRSSQDSSFGWLSSSLGGGPAGGGNGKNGGVSSHGSSGQGSSSGSARGAEEPTFVDTISNSLGLTAPTMDTYAGTNLRQLMKSGQVTINTANALYSSEESEEEQWEREARESEHVGGFYSSTDSSGGGGGGGLYTSQELTSSWSSVHSSGSSIRDAPAASGGGGSGGGGGGGSGGGSDGFGSRFDHPSARAAFGGRFGGGNEQEVLIRRMRAPFLSIIVSLLKNYGEHLRPSGDGEMLERSHASRRSTLDSDGAGVGGDEHGGGWFGWGRRKGSHAHKSQRHAKRIAAGRGQLREMSLFDSAHFVAEASDDAQPLLTVMLATQLFSYFVQLRISSRVSRAPAQIAAAVPVAAAEDKDDSAKSEVGGEEQGKKQDAQGQTKKKEKEEEKQMLQFDAFDTKCIVKMKKKALKQGYLPKILDKISQRDDMFVMERSSFLGGAFGSTWKRRILMLERGVGDDGKPDGTSVLRFYKKDPRVDEIDGKIQKVRHMMRTSKLPELRRRREALELEKKAVWRKSLRGTLPIVPGETNLWIPYRTNAGNSQAAGANGGSSATGSGSSKSKHGKHMKDIDPEACFEFRISNNDTTLQIRALDKDTRRKWIAYVKAKARKKETVEKLCQMYLPKDEQSVKVLAVTMQEHDKARIEQNVKISKMLGRQQDYSQTLGTGVGGGGNWDESSGSFEIFSKGPKKKKKGR